MGQIILAVDDNGKFMEYISKELGHTGKGRRHLAITVLLSNSKGQILLQKRKHKIFDKIWDFTGATHPLHKPHSCHSEDSDVRRRTWESSQSVEDCRALRARNDKEYDETLEEATRRCLKVEWGITETKKIRELGVFNYFAKDGEHCENEHCFLMIGEYNGEVDLDPEIGYEYKWEGKNQFLNDVAGHPQKFAPWVIEGIKILKQAKFFDGLDKVLNK